MSVPSPPAVPRPRLRRALRLIEAAPAPAALAIGISVFALGVFIVTRPLTSLWLLAIVVGAAAILAGVLDLADSERSRTVWYRIVCVLCCS